MGQFDGQFYWPSEEYSTPTDSHCWHVPESPNADFRCVRRDGHPGKHHYEWSPDIRGYSHKAIEPDGWVPIVHCPTDGSAHMMRLPDGTEFVGRWGTSQQRWQKRTGPELVTDKHAGVGERVIWSNLPEATYPSHFKPL